MSAYIFLRDFYNSDFTIDMIEDKMHIDLDYSMLHCESCARQGYQIHHENCVSGGRYCLRPSQGPQGKSFLSVFDLFGRILINKCVEKILKDSLPLEQAKKKIFEYYWTLAEGCLPEDKPRCTQALLEKRIQAESFSKASACVRESFVKQKDKDGQEVEMELLDNTILADQRAKFEKVKDLGNFPLVQINDIVFNGPLDYHELGTYICNHLSSSFRGCYDLNRKEKLVNGAGTFFRVIIVISIGLLVLASLMLCKRHLKERYQRELNYKVNQTIDSYMSRSDDVM